MKEKGNEVSILEEVFVIEFIHIVLVDEVVEEGIGREELKDFGCRAEDAVVSLDDTTGCAVLRDRSVEVGLKGGVIVNDVAVEICLGVLDALFKAEGVICVGADEVVSVEGKVRGCGEEGHEVRVL